MSLINDMLNDLEARRANDLKRPGLQGEVRPLPKLDRRDGLRIPVLIGVLAAIGGGLAWYLFPAAAPFVPVSPVATTPAVPLPPLQEIQAPVVEASAASAPVEMAALRAATSLSALPASPASSSSVASTTTTTIATAQPVRSDLSALKVQNPPKLASPTAGKPAAESSGAIDKRAVYANPRERLEADYRQAVQAAGAGRVQEAGDQLRDILRQDPSFSLARQALLRLLLEQRRVDDMMTVLAEGLDLQPNQTGWAVSLARLFVERGEYASAQRILARSYPHATGNPEYLGFYAHVQYKLNHHKEAAELYLLAAKLSPAEGRWWLGLGVALEGDGRNGEAREAYRKALATGSLNADLTSLAEQKLR